MTTKTKAHGFVRENWDMEMDLLDRVKVAKVVNGQSTLPICLIHPFACDKVREFLLDFENRSYQQAAELLKLLPDCEE